MLLIDMISSARYISFDADDGCIITHDTDGHCLNVIGSSECDLDQIVEDVLPEPVEPTTKPSKPQKITAASQQPLAPQYQAPMYPHNTPKHTQHGMTPSPVSPNTPNAFKAAYSNHGQVRNAQMMQPHGNQMNQKGYIQPNGAGYANQMNQKVVDPMDIYAKYIPYCPPDPVPPKMALDTFDIKLSHPRLTPIFSPETNIYDSVQRGDVKDGSYQCVHGAVSIDFTYKWRFILFKGQNGGQEVGHNGTTMKVGLVDAAIDKMHDGSDMLYSFDTESEEFQALFRRKDYDLQGLVISVTYNAQNGSVKITNDTQQSSKKGCNWIFGQNMDTKKKYKLCLALGTNGGVINMW